MPSMDFLVHHLLRSSVDRHPDREALVDGQRRLTYAQVRHQVEALAGALTALGVEPLRPDWRATTGLASNRHRLARQLRGGRRLCADSCLALSATGRCTLRRIVKLKVLITQQAHWRRLQNEPAHVPAFEHVILTDGTDPQNSHPPIHSWTELMAPLMRPRCRLASTETWQPFSTPPVRPDCPKASCSATPTSSPVRPSSAIISRSASDRILGVLAVQLRRRV